MSSPEQLFHQARELHSRVEDLRTKAPPLDEVRSTITEWSKAVSMIASLPSIMSYAFSSLDLKGAETTVFAKKVCEITPPESSVLKEELLLVVLRAHQELNPDQKVRLDDLADTLGIGRKYAVDLYGILSHKHVLPAKENKKSTRGQDLDRQVAALMDGERTRREIQETVNRKLRTVDRSIERNLKKDPSLTRPPRRSKVQEPKEPSGKKAELLEILKS